MRIGVFGDTKKFSHLIQVSSRSGLDIQRLYVCSSKRLTSFELVIFIVGKKNLNPLQISIVRQYVEEGGTVIVLHRKGGDRLNNSHWSSLIEGVSTRNDMVFSECIPYHQPKEQIQWSHISSSCSMQIIYDGGCSFDVSSKVLENPMSVVVYGRHQSLDEIRGPDPLARQKYSTKHQYSQITNAGALLVHIPLGKGTVTYWGARWVWSNSLLSKPGHFDLWLSLLNLSMQKTWGQILTTRMERVQRHRLLHAYPMTSGLKPYTKHPRQLMNTHRNKRSAIGIIPHTFCNTGRRGCGFCTFPHESFSKDGIQKSMYAVVEELKYRKVASNSFSVAPVSSIYIGGGTANLSDAQQWKEILIELSSLPIHNKTECTLEGAPLYFWSKRTLLEDLCSILPSVKKRISIGVQSFHKHHIEQMGRQLMNRKLNDVLGLCSSLGVHVSIDLLCNLPGQTTDEILSDIHMAVDLGIDHICIYNLVSYPGLGTEWSLDKEIQKKILSQRERIQNMERVYQEMDRLGYEAITLTDFCRRGSGEAGRYRYEEDIREPEKVNWWGVGPGGISVLWDKIYGVKLVNPQQSSAYISRINEFRGPTWDAMYHYDQLDRKVYWLTRQIKGLSIDKEKYEHFFHTDLESDFGPILRLLKEHALLDKDLCLSIKGRYFADSICGLLVEYIFSLKHQKSMVYANRERAQYLMHRLDQQRGNDSRPHFMG